MVTIKFDRNSDDNLLRLVVARSMSFAVDAYRVRHGGPWCSVVSWTRLLSFGVLQRHFLIVNKEEMSTIVAALANAPACRSSFIDEDGR